MTYTTNVHLSGMNTTNTGPSDPLLHVTWTERETADASTNHDIVYAYNKDRGRTWRNNAGMVVSP